MCLPNQTYLDESYIRPKMKKRTYRIHVKGANKVKNIGNNVAEQRQFHKTQETLH